MHRFFGYYGSKTSSAVRYGEPRHELVIEPFAGSAGYSVFWNVRKVKLYDIRQEVCELWDWLIKCPIEEIEVLPDWVESVEQVLALPQPAQNLVSNWLVFSGDEIGKFHKDRSIDFYLRDVEEYKSGIRSKPSLWCPDLKTRIILQKPLIVDWTIDQMSYEDVPNVEAHWHVDPPYESQMKAYDSSQSIDFSHLAGWCRNRHGTVDVCEEAGAKWLPFRPLHTRPNNQNKLYTEMIWRKNYNPRQMDMFPIDWEKLP